MPHPSQHPRAHTPPDSPAGIATPSGTLTRRQWVLWTGVSLAGATLTTACGPRDATRDSARDESRNAAATAVTMFASSGCECCHLWVAHLEDNGFRVRTEFVVDMAAKKGALGLPPALWSCHTAEIDGRLVEGHVPAAIIRRFLAERTGERGIAAPGMPGGSPGMESAPKQDFDIIAFGSDGATRVYARA